MPVTPHSPPPLPLLLSTMSVLAKSHASLFLVQYDLWKKKFFHIQFAVMRIIIFTCICGIYWQHRPKCAGYIQRQMEKQTQETCLLPNNIVDNIAKCSRTSPSPMAPDVICLAMFCHLLKLSPPFTVTKSALIILYTNSVLNRHFQKSRKSELQNILATWHLAKSFHGRILLNYPSHPHPHTPKASGWLTD